MDMEKPNEVERAVIAEHAQRTAERTALRKVRKTLDHIEEAARSERRALHKVLIVCLLLAALGGWFFWWLIFSDRGLPKSPPMKVPATLQQKQ